MNHPSTVVLSAAGCCSQPILLPSAITSRDFKTNITFYTHVILTTFYYCLHVASINLIIALLLAVTIMENNKKYNIFLQSKIRTIFMLWHEIEEAFDGIEAKNKYLY